MKYVIKSLQSNQGNVEFTEINKNQVRIDVFNPLGVVVATSIVPATDIKKVGKAL